MRTKKLSTLILLHLIVMFASAQPYSMQYKSYFQTSIFRLNVSDDGRVSFIGGTPKAFNSFDVFYSISDSDKEIIGVIDREGDFSWKFCGGILNSDAKGFNFNDVETFDDGSIAVAGNLLYYHINWEDSSYTEPVFMYFNANGNLVWAKKIMRQAYSYMIAWDMLKPEVDGNNHFFVLIKGTHDVSFIKIDGNGNTLFNKAIRTDSPEINGTVLKDNNLLVVLSPSSQFGPSNLILIKTDLNGNVLWTKEDSNPFPFSNYPSSHNQSAATPDNGVFIAGVQYNQNPMLCFSKFDSLGNNEWCAIDSSLQYLDISKVIALNDGSYLIGAHQWFYYEQLRRATLIKVDSNGDIHWAKQKTSYSAINDIALTPDGYLQAGGYSADDFNRRYAWLEKIDLNNFTNCWRDLPFGNTTKFTIQMEDTTFTFIDETFPEQAITFKNDHPLQKYDDGDCSTATTDDIPPTIFPNPANGFIYLVTPSIKSGTATLTIYNCLGQVVRSITEIHEGVTQIDVAGYAKGVYIYKVDVNNEFYNGKIIIK